MRCLCLRTCHTLCVFLFCAVASASDKAVVRVDLGVSEKAAAEYDWAFRGKQGQEFKDRVLKASKKVDLNPGLLAANLIAETRRDEYLRPGPVSSFTIGADDYYEKRTDIKRKVPAATDVSWTPGGTDTNETGRKVTTIVFPDGGTALLASAVYLKHGEEVLRAEAKALGRDFDDIPLETRFALVRIAFNAGLGRAKRNLADALEGKEVLVRNGSEKPPWGPQRAATVLTVRALRLSDEVFGVRLP